MRMRHAVLFAALPAVLALAACGSDDGADSTTVPPADTQPTGAGGFDYATGPDDVVVQVSQEGGFVPAGFVFTATPMLSITGDGHVFTPGVMTIQYPGPLIAPTSVQTIIRRAWCDNVFSRLATSPARPAISPGERPVFASGFETVLSPMLLPAERRAET